MSIERKHVAEQIENLIRQKKLGEQQLLHLMWIFAQEENVKITRSENRRLLRLEKYTDDTLKKVMEFLNEVEKYPIVKNIPQQQGSHTKTQHQQPSPVDNTEQLRTQEMKRQKVSRLQQMATPSNSKTSKLPIIQPDNVKLDHNTDYADADIVRNWFIRQTKLSKAAKKMNPQLIAPTGTGSALPISIRVVPKKKKRKPRKKSNVTKKRKEQLEETPIDDDENIDDVADDADENADEVIDDALAPIDAENQHEEDGEIIEGGGSSLDENEEAPVGFEMEKEEGEDDDENGEDDDVASDDEDVDDGEDEDDENIDVDDDRKKESNDMELESSSE